MSLRWARRTRRATTAPCAIPGTPTWCPAAPRDEYKAQNLPNAALKLVPANPALTEARLSHWTTAAALSHPHLIRLLEAGRCQLGGLQFLFVVMEYAEQTLSQILPQRALTPDEVREMLLPTLDALAFLHRMSLGQGQLKPANILVVNDQLKLA